MFCYTPSPVHNRARVFCYTPYLIEHVCSAMHVSHHYNLTFDNLGERPHTISGGSLYSEGSSKRERVMSAPATMHRAQSAASSRIKSASTVRSKRLPTRPATRSSDKTSTIQTASKDDNFIKYRQAWNRK